MKFALYLFVCLIAAVSAELVRSPTFVVRDGRLVRDSDDDRVVSKLPRLVGGGNAEPNSAPWMISLQWGTIRPAHFCGGALIAPNWVLTAAHCSSSYPNFGISTLVSGLHDLNAFFGHEQIRRVDMDQIFPHDDWTGFVGPNDISLMLVAQPFVEDATVRPIALPDSGEVHTGSVRLHGWGSTSTGFIPVFPTILQTVEKPLITIAQCAPLFPNVVVDDTNICTGPLTGGASACSGDSGSPLVQGNELVGIFSHTFIPCGQANRPSVYARVSAYISWINDVMDDFQAKQH